MRRVIGVVSTWYIYTLYIILYYTIYYMLYQVVLGVVLPCDDGHADVPVQAGQLRRGLHGGHALPDQLRQVVHPHRPQQEVQEVVQGGLVRVRGI